MSLGDVLILSYPDQDPGGAVLNVLESLDDVCQRSR